METDFDRLFAATSSFDDERFEKLDLSGADFGGKELTGCTFVGCRLPETSWDRSVLEDCVFDGCDLTNVVPKRMAMRGVIFRGCKLVGARWTDGSTNPLVTFTDCGMRYQSFLGIKLGSTRFVRCAIVESTFIDVDLTRAVFDECDLAQTQIERCELVGADFTSSRNVFFDSAKNRIKGARIPVETAALMAAALGLIVQGYGEPPRTRK